MQNTTTRLVWPEIPAKEQWLPYLEESIEQNWHTNTGPASVRLEVRLQEMFAQTGEKAVVTSSATAALSACLIAHHIRGPVICPAFTFQATPSAILGANCQPVIVDVDPQTGIVSAVTLEHALRETRAAAAMLVVPYGVAVDFSEHAEICRKAGARLILDNAAGLCPHRQSCDSALVAEHVEEVFSLHATKVFGIGEGGVVFCAPEHEVALRSAINFGLNTHSATGAPRPPYWGINGKMSEAMAAIGLAVADSFEERVGKRQAMAQRWIDALSETRVRIFCHEAWRAPWQVFPIQLADDATVTEFAARMLDAGIETRRYYRPSLGECEGMTNLGPCPNAKTLSDRAIALPVRSYMPVAEQKDLMSRTFALLNALPGGT